LIHRLVLLHKLDDVSRKIHQEPTPTGEPSIVGYTPQQGQYLAFIYAYTTLNRRPPAEADMQAFFRVSAPSVHQMVVTLERRGFIRRTPGAARSIALLVSPASLPLLEPR
jgi:repressor LexA